MTQQVASMIAAGFFAALLTVSAAYPEDGQDPSRALHEVKPLPDGRRGANRRARFDTSIRFHIHELRRFLRVTKTAITTMGFTTDPTAITTGTSKEGAAEEKVMKEVKAYVRIHMLDKVIRGLEEAGFTDMTVDDLRVVRRGLRDEDLEYSLELAERYMNVAKVALVVRNYDVTEVTRIICERARTGRKGDGLVYVSPVENAISVRTGKGGESAVESPSK